MIRITIETDDAARGTAQVQNLATTATTAGMAAPISAGEPASYLHHMVATQTGAANVLAATPSMAQAQPAVPPAAIDAGAAPTWLSEAVKEATVRAAEDILRRGEGI